MIEMSYGPSRDSKEQCHKMTDNRQKTFFKHSESSGNSLRPSRVNAILAAMHLPPPSLPLKPTGSYAPPT